ncbi:MAG: hypothetical protein AAF497_20305, partial [Planctomycetota bacterium]
MLRNIWLSTAARCLLTLCAFSAVLPTSVCLGDENKSAEEMANRVDELMADLWKQQEVMPAKRSGDSEFLRRIYLDLTGITPP